MKYAILTLLLLGRMHTTAQTTTPVPATSKIVLVVHGGAGTILKNQMTAEKETAYKAALAEALQRGYQIIRQGGSSVDAVEASVKVLEDNPLFNAGKGAVFTHDGVNELDASIMDGRSLKAGAIAGVSHIKNPVSAARAVMEKSEHVLLTGKGAELFASRQGLEMVDPSYFFTNERWQSLRRLQKEDSARIELDHTPGKPPTPQNGNSHPDKKFGTVGAVALDKYGNLAAATSTGGMTNKQFGRVGDSPIIGAGTYADNQTCAISCTGWGEFFIRLVLAKSVCDMIAYGKMDLAAAAEEMIMKKLTAIGGDGGLIALDNRGNMAMPFNTAGMYRGYVDEKGTITIQIYR